MNNFFVFKKNYVFDALKWVAQIFLPALGTLYFSLARIWGLPYAEEVLGSVAAVDTFLGVILGISTAQYNKLMNTKEGIDDGSNV